MTKQKINPRTNYKDLSYLTPYEEKIYNLMLEGLKPEEIAERIGNKVLSVINRIPIIREKVALHEITQKQDRYPNL